MTAVQVDREQFLRQGFVVVPEMLWSEEVTAARPVFEKLLPPDRDPPGMPDYSRNGRRVLIVEHAEPALANLCLRPRLVEAVEQLLGPNLLSTGTGQPVMTYKTPPGHERFEPGFHVDWDCDALSPEDRRYVGCALHFNTMRSGGGALMVCPGSHRVFEQAVKSRAPDLRRRMRAQDYTGFPGLAGPVEALVPAGGAVFYHPYLVHDRSENMLDVPRIIHFGAFRSFESTDERTRWITSHEREFSARHVAAMDDRERALCGVDVKGARLKLV